MAGLLLFDGDCGFCTSSARYAGKIAPRVDVQPWQRVDLAALGLTADEANASLQWVDADERAHGAAAVAALLVAAGGAWSLLGRLLRLPGLRLVAELAYRVVAANRSHLPGGTPACRLP